MTDDIVKETREFCDKYSIPYEEFDNFIETNDGVYGGEMTEKTLGEYTK